MSSIVPLEEIEEVEQFEPDEFGFDHDFLFKVTSPEGTDEVCSPDEVCDLILDLVEDQFWDWWAIRLAVAGSSPLKVYEAIDRAGASSLSAELLTLFTCRTWQRSRNPAGGGKTSDGDDLPALSRPGTAALIWPMSKKCCRSVTS